jgi:hypothetical protein
MLGQESSNQESSSKKDSGQEKSTEDSERGALVVRGTSSLMMKMRTIVRRSAILQQRTWSLRSLNNVMMRIASTAILTLATADRR